MIRHHDVFIEIDFLSQLRRTAPLRYGDLAGIAVHDSPVDHSPEQWFAMRKRQSHEIEPGT
jgi:hypothetical protein